MKKCIILQGVSGSGKSTYVEKLGGEYPDVEVFSADCYFTDILKPGSYNFDPAKLGEAHADCLKGFVAALTDGVGMVVVDNTNCSAVEIAPYLALAQAYGYGVHIRRIKCELADAIERAEKGPHKTPAKAVIGQWRTLKCYDPPPWWPQVEVVG